MTCSAMTMRRMDQEGTQREPGAIPLQMNAPGSNDRSLGELTMTGSTDRGPDGAGDAAAAGIGAAQRQGTTLTKAELADLLFDQVGLNKREAKDMVEAFFDEIGKALIRGESVKLSGFGNFVLRDKPQRPGRNPKTGEAIPISARRVVTFHASQKLKGQIDAAGTGGSRMVAGGTAELLITDGMTDGQ